MPDAGMQVEDGPWSTPPTREHAQTAMRSVCLIAHGRHSDIRARRETFLMPLATLRRQLAVLLDTGHGYSLAQRIPALFALSGPIMAGMGLVRLSAEAEMVREGYAQIYTQGETQKEIIDAKRRD
jgi:hypothetical protein